MPIERRSPPKPPETQSLLDELKREWELGEQSTNSEPRIILEERSKRSPLHIYVIWSKWENLSQLYRSEIIMDAAEKVLEPEDMIRITIAMGLTSEDELKRMGQ
jgi:hypothetical protein